MTAIKHPRTLALVALGAIVALGALATPASARWYDRNDSWRWHSNDRYYGYYYREPPIVYATPYRYVPPPVVYDATPGFTFHIGP